MPIDRIDLTEANGYILEEQGSNVIQAMLANSGVERFARREAMASRTKSVPRFIADAPVVVAEGAEIPAAEATLDDVVLTARKYAKLFHISEEDVNDSLVDTLSVYKKEWASRWARKFDNACLGVSGAADGTDAKPYNSVLQSIIDANLAGTNLIATNGSLTYAQLNTALSLIEGGDYFDAANTVWMAHPKMLSEIRGMVKGNNDLVLPDPLAGTPGSLFGYPLVVSYGAATSTAATDNPVGEGGSPFILAGNRQMLINGIRGGVESVVSRDAEFARDGVVLKTRVRRGFAVADAAAFALVIKSEEA